MSSPNELLELARGPLFDLAVAVFVIGVVLRLFEILGLGRARQLSEARGSEFGPGLKTIFTRSLVDRERFVGAPVVVIGGYLFHIGFFICLFLFVPHIELLHSTIGLRWPGLPTPFVDASAVITMLALVLLLVNRLTSPLLRFLSTAEDYFLLLLCLATVLTGYLAFHRVIAPYQLGLSLHLFSVELLMVVFPFTKLMHAFTVFLSRWYNGAMAGRKGVES